MYSAVNFSTVFSVLVNFTFKVTVVVTPEKTGVEFFLIG